MRPTRAVVASAALALLVGGGCGLFGSDGGGKGGQAPRRTTTSPTTTTTTTPVVRAEGPELIEPGAEPRRVLRLSLTEGSTATVTITSDLFASQDDGSATRKVDPPPIVQTVEYRVGATGEDGSDLSFAITDMTVAAKGTLLTPDAVAKLDRGLRAAVGIEGHGHLDRRGAMSDVSFDLAGRRLGKDVRAQIEALPDQLAALTPRLPEDDVGAGARWRTTDPVRIGGVEIDEVVTTTVTALEGNAVTYRSTIAATAAPQTLPAPAGETRPTRLTAASYAGSAAGTLRLDRPISAGSTTVEGRLTLTIPTDDGAEATVQQSVRVITRIRDAD